MNSDKQHIFESERLKFIVLTSKQLSLMANDIPSLEKELGVSYKGETVDSDYKRVLESAAKNVAEDPDNIVWRSVWLIVRKSDNTVVGSSDFKRVPDENGETEIGYGLSKEFEHNGYMTETVEFMCRFAGEQEGVKAVLAETVPQNLPSQNVLKRCGFELYKTKENLWWKRKV